MKKKATGSKRKAPGKLTTKDFGALIAEVRSLIQSARHAAATTVNMLQVLTNFEIGRRIVDHEQRGAARAEYGKELLKELSARPTEEFGKGFSRANLEYMRKFFLLYSDRQQISRTLSRELTESSQRSFTLSWSHYILLTGIKNPDELSFYEIEAASQDWSLRELKRQVASGLYERLALSRDKKSVRKLAGEGQALARPEDMLMDDVL